jgi:hypothetical protein
VVSTQVRKRNDAAYAAWLAEVTALRAEAVSLRARYRWRCLSIWIHNTTIRRVARFTWYARTIEPLCVCM